MPISAIDDCTEAHWVEVNQIISDAVTTAGFEPNLVSTADEVGVIQKTIIQNLYDNPIVVCDVSGKNPNVMFELGLRLAFDKPTIIIKDDRTPYSFDTGQIEHIDYPRDLRFSKIVDFKKKLSKKISATYEKSQNDSDYTTFLKHFGEFKVAKLEQKEVSGQEFILDEIRQMRQLLRRIDTQNRGYIPARRRVPGALNLCLKGQARTDAEVLMNTLLSYPGVTDVTLEMRGENHPHLYVEVTPDSGITEDSLQPLVGHRRAAPRRPIDDSPVN